MAQDGLAQVAQADWSAGAFPGMEVVPPNGAEDIVNGVLEQDGSVPGRGGTAYRGSLSASDTRRFLNVWSGALGGQGPFTLVSKAQGSGPVTQGFSVLSPGASDFVATTITDQYLHQQRPVGFGGAVVLVSNGPGTGVHLVAWGGYVGALPDGTATITVNHGEQTVAGSGFNAIAARGKMLNNVSTIGDRMAVIASVTSDTSLELLAPWAGPDTAGVLVNVSTYAAYDAIGVHALPAPVGSDRPYAATIFDRLVIARGGRVAFTGGSDPMVVAVDDFHPLSGGGAALGLEPLRDQMLVFTTAGIFTISGMAYDLTDAAGNQQQRLELTVPDVVLWDDRGIAGWQGAIVVPGIDDVYLMESAGSLRPTSGGIRNLYRSYVQDGHRTGVASVFQGRYFLPILHGGEGLTDTVTWIDTLVCDLRSGAWVRWDGQAAVSGLTRRTGDSSNAAPQLLALGATGSTRRVQDFTPTLDPDSSSSGDADGSSYDLKVTTRTYSGPGLVKHTWKLFRARLELGGSPTVTVERAEGKPGSSFTALSSPRVDTDDGESIYRWPFTESSRSIRFRVTVHASSSRPTLRQVDAFFRQTYRP